MKVVAVGGERVHGNQAFDEQIFQFDKESESLGRDDERGKFIAHAVEHELDLFPLDEFALGFGSAALAFGRRRGDRAHVGLIDDAVEMRA